MRDGSDARIGMKHGAGGRAMRALIEEVFVRGLSDGVELEPGEVGLAAMDDGAAIPVGDRFLVVTTDSHVISPIFFPGGDIGRLAIAGTVNDLAMMGATEIVALTSAVVVEEGFSRSDLERVGDSMRSTAREAGVRVVTGDTKVMGKGEIDGLLVNTAGVAFADRVVVDAGLHPGDRILVTGTIGDHGLAVMAVRNGLGLDGELRSDVAPLSGLVRALLARVGDAVTAMKDPTRGGLASSLHEMSKKSRVGVVIEESAIPLSQSVRAASDLLGIDPLHVANEGKAVIGVRPEAAELALEALRAHPLGRHAAIIGTVTADREGSVIVDTGFGRRLLSELEGEPLPRIC
jgi:hydrogenase expression/formation protein HypE